MWCAVRAADANACGVYVRRRSFAFVCERREVEAEQQQQQLAGGVLASEPPPIFGVHKCARPTQVMHAHSHTEHSPSPSPSPTNSAPSQIEPHRPIPSATVGGDRSSNGSKDMDTLYNPIYLFIYLYIYIHVYARSQPIPSPPNPRPHAHRASRCGGRRGLETGTNTTTRTGFTSFLQWSGAHASATLCCLHSRPLRDRRRRSWGSPCGRPSNTTVRPSVRQATTLCT